MGWLEKARQRNPMLPDQERVDSRFNVLRGLGLSAQDAHPISWILEYRCLCHERLGGVDLIIVEEP